MRTRYRILSRGVEWHRDEILISRYLIEIKYISRGLWARAKPNSGADRINAPVLDLGQVRSGIGF
jgi:hypothetical protein